MSHSDPRSLAALDLGSNSFHMIVARQVGDEMRVLDRLREPVRLAGGMGKDKRISDEAMLRALSCLERFAERLRELNAEHVRAVGTNTLRSAKNGDRFRMQAENVLGFPIEVISGQEEARLIYLGVSHTTGPHDGLRLVADIGGGSTEVIVGDGFDVVRGHSLFMGCVSFTKRYFGNGKMSARRFRDAETAAALELLAVEREIRSLDWTATWGASGTIRAVGSVLKAQQWSDGRVTLAGLDNLRRAMIDAKAPDKMKLEGLKADRLPVFAGGVAILNALFEHLGISEMDVASGALREGVLYDLVGRLDHEDVRERTIKRFVSHFHVDVAQANRVDHTAGELLGAARESFGRRYEHAKDILHWASQLHELGLDIAYTGYHKHSAYVIENAHMPGFSSDDQRTVSRIVRFHRRSVKHAHFEDLPDASIPFVRRLTVIFRLAVILNRSRTDEPTPSLEIDEPWSTLRLGLDPEWSQNHPLTVADLHDEAEIIGELGSTLMVDTGERAKAE